jgi:ABC-type dipeptide/oligopeptide/nickel transport system permease component
MRGTALQFALTLAVSFLVCFFGIDGLPGDPADGLDSPDIPAAQAERTRAALGLDRPAGERLVATLTSYARGDFGISVSRKRPVSRVIAESLPYSAALGTAALILAYVLGVSTALFVSGLRRRWRRRWGDVLLAGALVPRFWFSLLLVLVFAGMLGWLPSSHAGPPGGGSLGQRFPYLVLPALALGLPAACVVGRLHLAAMERSRRDLHVIARRAAGSTGLALRYRHQFRPIAGMTATLVALDLPVIVSGAVVIEWVFSWPGTGRLVTDALMSGDYPLALATTSLTVVGVLAGRALAEAMAGRLDPRQATAAERW